jgi:hypothetical protein
MSGGSVIAGLMFPNQTLDASRNPIIVRMAPRRWWCGNR